MSIHREKYTRYDGPLYQGTGWWVIAVETIKHMVGFLRTKILVPALWIVPLITAVAIVAEYGLRGNVDALQAPDGSNVVPFLQVQLYSVALLYMASGPGVVSDDLRHNVLQLYRSKPLELWEYTFGKWLGLFLLGTVVTVGPAITVGLLRIALLSQYGMAGAVAVDVTWAVVLSAVMTGLAAAIVLGLSSTTTRSGFVVLAWIGLLVVPPMIALLVGLSIENPDLSGLLTFQGNFQMVSEVLVAGDSLEIPVWAPLFGLAAYGGGGIGLHLWRLRQLEKEG